MPTLTYESIQAYRARTFRHLPGQRIRSQDEAVEYVNQRGFIFFWPIKDIAFPSLWTAVAGNRPVADEHDDPGHKTWGWKDALLGKCDWYYAKILRKKSTMVSMKVVPYFYALSENYGAPEVDYLTLYEQGRLTQEAKQVYEAVLKEGPLDTVALRKAARLSSRESDSRFNKALTDLQADFKIVPAGVTEAGAWHYAFAYDIVARHYPEIPVQAQHIREGQARQVLAEHFFRSVGAAQIRDLTRLFSWSPRQAGRAVDSLVEAGLLERGLEVADWPGEWIAVKELKT